MLRKFLQKSKDDRGSSLITSLFVIPVMIAVLVTIIDVSLFFANKSQVQAVARDGARTVAIMGGNGSSSKGTPLEKQYGQSRTDACSEVSGSDAYSSSSSAIECNILDNLLNHKGIVNSEIRSVICTPSKANFIGQRVSCEVQWQYRGFPLSLMGAAKALGTNEGLRGVTVTAGSSESEVNLNNVDLVNR